ncbi:fluoride efflux transporter CrcB, partial [Mesorhizobium sp. M7A.F.Ca.CA.001.09.1.1]
MFNLLLVVVGGGVGAGIRHLTNIGALRFVGPNYPWGTMAIN